MIFLLFIIILSRIARIISLLPSHSKKIQLAKKKVIDKREKMLYILSFGSSRIKG
jgi:hypothetical protein